MIPIVPVPPESDFSLQNLPFGVFSVGLQRPNVCATRLGDTVVDLSVLEQAGWFDDVLPHRVFDEPTLNRFLALSKPQWLNTRKKLQELLQRDSSLDASIQKVAFYDIDVVTLHMPIQVADYTDFYSSRYHAENVGEIFRGSRALQPNWKSLPVAYHGRSSTVFVSGTPILRPNGQQRNDDGTITHGASRQLDFEVELATVVGGFAEHDDSNAPLTIETAKSHIFGFLLMNDWSARDLQRWEYVPLGPFTAKNFGTTVSPWIVMAEALATVAPLESQDDVLDYLRHEDRQMYDIDLSATISSSCGKQATVCNTNSKFLYWSAAQQLVHHGVSGCLMKTGDVLGSGTISSPTCGGSMLELTKNGETPVAISANVYRSFLEDGDSVVLRGVSRGRNGERVGFGPCEGTIVTTMPTGPTVNRQPYTDFVLYGTWQSSATWRVRTALASKKTSYTITPIDLSKGEHKTEEYLCKNPIGQVPLLECTDTRTEDRVFISQSLAIIQFLEDIFPDTVRLWPTDPAEKAFANQVVEMINSGTQPMQNTSFLALLEEKSNGVVAPLMIGRLVNEKGLDAVEKLISKRSRQGPYALGTFQPTIVDICLIPQLHNAKERYGIDTRSAFPTLDSIQAVCVDHHWFKGAHPTQQPDAPKLS